MKTYTTLLSVSMLILTACGGDAFTSFPLSETIPSLDAGLDSAGSGGTDPDASPDAQGGSGGFKSERGGAAGASGLGGAAGASLGGQAGSAGSTPETGGSSGTGGSGGLGGAGSGLGGAAGSAGLGGAGAGLGGAAGTGGGVAGSSGASNVEVCDGKDNNGDGRIDEGNVCKDATDPCTPGAIHICDCYGGVHQYCNPSGHWGGCIVDIEYDQQGNAQVCFAAAVFTQSACTSPAVCDFGKCKDYSGTPWHQGPECVHQNDCPTGKVCDVGYCKPDPYTPSCQ